MEPLNNEQINIQAYESLVNAMGELARMETEILTLKEQLGFALDYMVDLLKDGESVQVRRDARDFLYLLGREPT